MKFPSFATLRKRGQFSEPEAAELDQRQKALDQLERKWLAVERRYAEAPTPGARDLAESELLNLEQPRREAQVAPVADSPHIEASRRHPSGMA